MIIRLRIAARNVLRNRRRTLLNIVMIAGGIAAIVLFRGFANNLIIKLQNTAINSQFGHLQVASDKTWKRSADDSPKDRLLTVDPELAKKIRNLKNVLYASGRISFFGLISLGDHSLSARGIGFDPGVESQMRDHMRVIEGRNLSAGSKFEVLLGSGLKDELGAKVGGSVTLLAYTVDGSVNAIDSELVGIFQSGLSEVDDSTFFMPLATAQKLLDTDAVERLVIQLKSTSATDATMGEIEKIVPPGLGVRAWHQLATFYQQCRQYFAVQNLVIEWILMMLVLLSIANTVGMAVSERTGEIGTTRAIGDTRRDILIQFFLEGLVLAGIGGGVGCIAGVALCYAVTAMKIPMVIPGASLPLNVEVDLLPSAFRDAFLLACAMAIFATVLPAFRASRLKIVEALKRNI